MFCASSMLCEPLLETSRSERSAFEWNAWARKLDLAEKASTSKHELCLEEPTPGKCRFGHTQTMKYITAAVLMVCLATCGASTLALLARSDSYDVNQPAISRNREVSSNDISGANALMMEYIQARKANDLDAFKKMIDSTTTMTIDVSKANSLIRAGARTNIPKLRMIGWRDIGSFYAKNRAEPEDTMPGVDDISCAGRTCHALFVITRGPFFFQVTLHMDSVFKWDVESGKIESMAVTIT